MVMNPAAQVKFTPSRDLFPFESKWFQSSVGKIHYVDEGKGRVILMFHGNPTWSFLYRHLITALKNSFRCIAIDYPGFGLSVRPDGYGYTPKEHAHVVSELVDHLDLQDVIVMGQDWGGPIGTAVALSAPERVSGVVFGSTWCWPSDRLMRTISWAASSWPIQWAIQQRPFFVNVMMKQVPVRKLTEDEFRHYQAVQPTPASRQGVAEAPRQLRKSVQWLGDMVGQIPNKLSSKPALFVWGNKDRYFKRLLPRWRDLYPDHVVVELPHASHYFQEDAPQEVAQAILKRFG